MLAVENIKKNLETEVQQIKHYMNYLTSLNAERIINSISARDAIAGIMDGRAIVKIYEMHLFDYGIKARISDEWQVSYND